MMLPRATQNGSEASQWSVLKLRLLKDLSELQIRSWLQHEDS
jgi:hypothetical protein